MSAEPRPDLQLEIAHLLLVDVVGYSRLLVNEQIELMQELNRVVRATECFRTAETSGKLIRVPTGDGMALLFFRSPEEPVRCALEISDSLKNHPHIRVRMGIHSGPVNRVTDVNDQSNVAGAGINVAQRVMDCGDAGHILLSKHLADDLAQYRHWQPDLHDLGECEVKHGLRLHLVNLYKDGLGNPVVPEKLKRGKRWKQASGVAVAPFSVSRWPKFGLIAALLISALALAISFSIFSRRGSPAIARFPSVTPATVALPIPEKSIAVLPFQNLSDDKQNAFLADGVQDEILTDLAQVADLKVISRTSVMQYKRTGAERNLREIAQALRVAHVVEGTVQRTGGRVRVSAQLIDARSDTHLWAEHYDRDLADVFAIESDLAQRIVSQLKARLSPKEKAAIENPPTSDLAAYDLYARAKAQILALAFNARGKEKLTEATVLLNEAVRRDPKFFLAYYELARGHDLLYVLGVDHTPARLALADAAVQSVLRLRPDSGEAHLALAWHLYCGYFDFDRARKELATALRTLPNEPFAFILAGFIDRRQGHWDESARNLERALDLDPHNPFILKQIAGSYYRLRRFADMATVLDRALTLVPEDVDFRVARALVDLEWRADPRRLHSTIEAIVAQDPNAATEFADQWLYVAMCERDRAAADRALAALTADGCRTEGISFPRPWCEGLAARARGDAVTARAAFAAARIDIVETVREQPAYGQALCVLGMIDAGLGRKEESIHEGRRAVELLPITKDSINGSLLIEYLAMIYAWTGEKDLALEQLAIAARIPSNVTYGQLRLDPKWDLLRGDPRFEKIVASLAPK